MQNNTISESNFTKSGLLSFPYIQESKFKHPNDEDTQVESREKALGMKQKELEYSE